MKKYLIKGLLALVAGGFAASCADKDVDYVPLAQQKSQAYEKAFEEMIGGKVDPNQDWGFESIALPEEDAATRAMTRGSEPNTAVWANYGYTEDLVKLKATTPSGKSEEQIVTEWFQTHTIQDAVSQEFTDYWVVQVHYNSGSYPATHHEWEKYENGKEVWKTNSNENVSPLGHMDQIYANKDNTGTQSDHIYNFNTNSGAFMLVTNSHTQYGFGYEESWGTDLKHVYNRSFMAHIVDEANGIDGYYVGFDYQTYKLENVSYTNENGEQVTYNNNKMWAIEPNGVYDDRIIKIIPGTGSTTPGTNPGTTPPPSETTTTTTQHIKKKVLVVQGRVFCEDLGTAGRKDIDFNDIVFDARIWYTFEFDRMTTGSNTEDKNYSAGKYEAEICLLAAGGTIPVKLAERNVHDIFQPAAGLTTMVNTVDDHADTDNWVTWENSSAERDPVTFTYDMTTIVNQKGTISLNDIPLEVLWTMGSSDDPSSGYGTMQSVGVLNANLGQVPHKICLPIGTVWPSERRSMAGAYKYFATWAMDKNSYPEFYKNEGDQVATDSLYTGKTTGLSLTDANGREYYTTNDGSIWTNYSAEEIRSSSSYSVIETTLWEGSQTYAPEASNNNLTIASVTFNVGDKFRVYGTNGSGSNRWITFKDDANQAIVSVNSGIDFSAKGYYSIVVETQDQARKFSNGPLLIIAAQDMTITKITKVSTSSN